MWSALAERARNPLLFLPGLRDCRIVAIAGGRIERELDFGAATVRDRVTLDEDAGWIRFEVARTASHAGGDLTIAIEHQDCGIGLCFTYRTTLEDAAADDGLAPAGYVRAAYHASDRDTVAIVRSLLGYGRAPV